jgi:hypothetical protein
MSWTINTPVKGFTGEVVGVTFKDGEGTTNTDPAYFRRHGYTVSETVAPAEEETNATDPKAESDAPDSTDGADGDKTSGTKTPSKAGK